MPIIITRDDFYFMQSTFKEHRDALMELGIRWETSIDVNATRHFNEISRGLSRTIYVNISKI